MDLGYIKVLSSKLLLAESVRSRIPASSDLSGFISGGSFKDPRSGNLTVQVVLVFAGPL